VKTSEFEAVSPRMWTVAELGAFYTERRFELHSHALRILKDSTRAEEVVQDAFIKVMLAAPELTSHEHAASYLHRTIENLCIDLFRAEGRRPNLVLLDDATAEVESQWQDSGDHSQALSAAEDAAIIRQALALLSPAERAALVMWEMEGRSTSEIASELGIKESAVRHTVSRARTSLRRILSELIIDEERGLTALDLLSTSYKKAAELAKKSSKAALSLVLIAAAFLGFQSFSGAKVASPGRTVEQAKPSSPAPTQSLTPSTNSDQSGLTQATTAGLNQGAVNSLVTNFTAALKVASTMMNDIQSQLAKYNWPGVGLDGLPSGFTVNDSHSLIGSANLINFYGGGSNTSVFSTDSSATNISLTQMIQGSGDNYTVNITPSARIAGAWVILNNTNTITSVSTRADGYKLLIVTLPIDQVSPVRGPSLGMSATGMSMSVAPVYLTAKIHLSADGSQVLGEAVQVLDSKVIAQAGA
jgi:hypothetical protein